jgi:hypothetical protein
MIDYSGQPAVRTSNPNVIVLYITWYKTCCLFFKYELIKFKITLNKPLKTRTSHIPANWRLVTCFQTGNTIQFNNVDNTCWRRSDKITYSYNGKSLIVNQKVEYVFFNQWSENIRLCPQSLKKLTRQYQLMLRITPHELPKLLQQA